MDSSVSSKEEIWFLRVCHHISNAFYLRNASDQYGRVFSLLSHPHRLCRLPSFLSNGNSRIFHGRMSEKRKNTELIFTVEWLRFSRTIDCSLLNGVIVFCYKQTLFSEVLRNTGKNLMFIGPCIILIVE